MKTENTTTLKLNHKQKEVISVLRKNRLKYNPYTGYYYYNVPTGVKDTGEMVVTQKELRVLVDLGVIDANAKLTELGKTCQLSEEENTTTLTERTQGEWNNDLHDNDVYCNGYVVAQCYSSFISPANYESMVKLLEEIADAPKDKIKDVIYRMQDFLEQLKNAEK